MPLSTAPPPPTASPQPCLLVVDDQPLNIQVLHQAFAADHRVMKALDGAAALDLCRRSHSRPDLILLDVVMPGIDGFEVCRQLKADPLTRDIPVIFVTAHDDVDHETHGLELGAVDFIVKPINVAVVRARVKTHLGFARSNSLLAATLQASSDGILSTDLAGGISSMNQAFAQMWRLPDTLTEAASCETLFACMRGQLSDPASGAFDGTPAAARHEPGDGPQVLELVGNRQVEREVVPLHVNGNLRGQVFIFREVTERRRAADALQRLNGSLESRILARTQELQDAMQGAQAASRAKSDFLSNMSHEIRTPMNAVIGLAFLALKTDPHPKQRAYLEKIQRSGQHLLNLVNDILDFSKIESGKLVLDETDFKLSTVFDSISSVSAESAKAKGLGLRFEIDPSLSRALCGDPLRLGQVLLNYVGNAIKFTPRGEVRVRATTEARFDAECLIRIEVEDSGIGLTEAQMAQLFQSFQQVDTSTTRDHGGTGLGLAVCKQLAELMGGRVGVHSRPGQGSVFWFTSRVRFGAPEVGGLAAAAPALPLGAPRDRLRGARVLLVEDNLLNQEVASGLLEDAGVTVTIAQHGQEALAHLAQGRFDCVLMDLQMPVMDGLQATRLIRADASLAGLPVLAMTANARSEDRARCLEAGMNDFVTKPVLPDRLYAVLAEWLAPRCAAPGCDPDIIDLSLLARQVGGNAQKVNRYGRLFVEALPESLAELQAALAQGQLPMLADLGHRMKSSARMVGALGLATLCESLEDFREGGALADAQCIVDRFPHLMARISADVATALPWATP